MWPELPLPQPELTGDGFSLRAWHLDDAAVLARAWSDPEIEQWLSVPPATDVAVARRWIAGDAVRRNRGLAIDAVITGSTTGDVVGEVGLSSFDPRRRAALVGYWLLPDERGRGVASAALGALTRWAGPAVGLHHLLAQCHPDNTASIAVAERAGYRRVDGRPGGHVVLVATVRQDG